MVGNFDSEMNFIQKCKIIDFIKTTTHFFNGEIKFKPFIFTKRESIKKKKENWYLRELVIKTVENKRVINITR